MADAFPREPPAAPPVVGPDGALSAELRERLVVAMRAVETRPGLHFKRGRALNCRCDDCQLAIVDAIVAELARAGWRNMAVRDLSDTITFPGAVADDEASAGTPTSGLRRMSDILCGEAGPE